MTKKIPYLCSMEIMLKKFCKKYKLPEKSLFDLLSHMEEVSFSKGELIIRKGDRNSNFYLIKKGIWRAYYLADGTENSLWFVGSGETAFSSWTYVEGKPSQINIESVNDSIAYCESVLADGDRLLVCNFGTDELNPLNTEGKGYVLEWKDGIFRTLIPADGNLSGPKGTLIKDSHLFIADVGKISGAAGRSVPGRRTFRQRHGVGRRYALCDGDQYG